MATEVVAKDPQSSAALSIGQFFEAVLDGNPFALNRVSDPSQMDCDVPGIHAAEFDRLTLLAEESLREQRGQGAILLGGAGTGKSHLLARFARWAAEQDRACFVFLHNIQVRPEDVGRYLLKCCISKLAEDRLDRLSGTPLFRVVNAAIRKAAQAERIVELNSKNQQDVYQRLWKQLGGSKPIFDVIFKFFYSASMAQQAKDTHVRQQHVEKAALAVRWLKGDLLDKEEAARLGQLVPPQQDVVQIGEDQVEEILLSIMRLAGVARKPFILCIDQADNMKPDQLTALCQSVHALIDHAENLLVVVSGVGDTMQAAIEQKIISEAAADRLNAGDPIVIRRIKPNAAQQILGERLHAFVFPFVGLPQLKSQLMRDKLFPLGSKWFARLQGNALDLRPRDVLSWASERWRQIKQQIQQEGPEAWLHDWEEPASPVMEPLTPEEILASIDSKVSKKLEESVAARKLEPGNLPADAGNLLGLTKQLLEQCLDRERGYTLRRVEARGKKEVDLLVFEQRPGDNTTIQNHVQFVVTGSKTSAAFQLRRLLDSKGADCRVLVTEARFPLQLGERGQEYLEALKKLGKHFEYVPLTFEQYAQLDALQAVVGQARSKDLEVEPRPNCILPVSEQEVIDSYHRGRRYEQHPLLRIFLAEEGPAKPLSAPTKFPPNDTFRQFVLAQLSLNIGSGLIELLTKFAAKQAPPVSVDTCLERAKEIVFEMHKEELVCAKPWEDDLYLTIGSKA